MLVLRITVALDGRYDWLPAPFSTCMIGCRLAETI